MRIAATILILTAAAALASPWQMVVARKKANAGGGAEDYLTDLIERWDGASTNGTEAVANLALFADASVGSGYYSFDGSGDYASAGDFDLANYITVCAWVRFDAQAVSMRIFAKWAGDGGFLFSTPSSAANKIRWAVQTGNGDLDIIDSDSTVSTGTWVHVAATWNGTNAAFFWNGQPEGTFALETASGTLPNGSQLTMMARQDTAATYSYFNGDLDDVRIYGAALTSAQVEQIYDATSGDH